MASKNDITGDSIKTRGPSKAYQENWEKIFGKPCPECGLKGEHKEDCSESLPKDKQKKQLTFVLR